MRSVGKQPRSCQRHGAFITHCGPSRELPAHLSPLSSFPSRVPDASESNAPRSPSFGVLRISSPAVLLSPKAHREVGRAALVGYTRSRVATGAAALCGGNVGSAVTGKQALLSFLLGTWLPNPAVNRTLRQRASFLSVASWSSVLSPTVGDAQRRLPSR